MIGVKAFFPLLQLPGICCHQTITAIAEQNLSDHIEIKFFCNYHLILSFLVV